MMSSIAYGPEVDSRADDSRPVVTCSQSSELNAITRNSSRALHHFFVIGLIA